NSGKVIVGMVGLFHPQKGHEYLLRAAAQLFRQGLELEVRLAGDGSLRPRIEALTEVLGLQGRVAFSGLIENVETFLQGLDIFVLPSVSREGLPMTLLEAMAPRLPVIASDVPGPQEVIAHEDNGLLTPPRDATSL